MHFPDSRVRVLYIDDEANNLLAFQAGFRRFYDIYTAETVTDGMNILNEQDIQVIIADQRMPRTTGVEFFNIIRKAHPDPVRILLTGYTDLDAVIDAINKGEIFRFIKKPWDEQELKMAIQNGYELYLTRKQLNDKVAELEKANDELNRFVYSTSHDLRSPLANIIGILNLANMQLPESAENEYFAMIESCVNKMDAFIHKTIEYYKGIRLDDIHETVDFMKMFSDSIELCNMQNPLIVFDVHVEQPVPFRCDAFRLSVILNNLISNAVKYQRTEEPNPIVRLSAVVTEKKATIYIEDNGVGIIEEHLNKIFQIFFRSTDFKNGLGIGLYIVKEALTRIGGEISVASEYGKGTSFTLTIPNQPQPA
ncbi:MAG: hybrid sensor histidine kinase/response regulator [Bacteroidetes bacterium]|nr:hybrid sensor histidine kinase/response regulator [Bacteroidota bacterium]